MMIISMIRAFVYYTMLTMYTYMYNIIAFLFYFSDKIINLGFYKNITMHYAHAIFLILRIIGLKIFINNKISNVRMLWISNHRSKFDGLLILILLRLHGSDIISVIKNSISYLPFFNTFSRHANSIFIKRVKSEAEKILVKKSKKSLVRGKSILIFPEGTTMSPTTKAYSDEYAIANNLKPFQNVLLPKTSGYDILQREGQFNKTGNITIRYANPIIPGISGHSYTDLFKIFPSVVYIDVKYHENLQQENLYKIFSEKDEELNQPIIKNNYQLLNNYSILSLFLNFIIFIIFYYLFFTIPYFMYTTLIFNIFNSLVSCRFHLHCPT